MTAKKSKESFFVGFSFFLFVGVVAALSFLNITYFEVKPSEIVVINTNNKDKLFWEKVKAKNPTYRDAYLVLAGIKNEEGDLMAAEELLRIAKTIDPYTKSGGL